MTEEKDLDFTDDALLTVNPTMTTPHIEEEVAPSFTPSVEDFLKSLKADLSTSKDSFTPTSTVKANSESRLTLMEKYTQEFQKRGPLQTQQFVVLKGWKDKEHFAQTEKQNFQFAVKRFLLPKDWQKTCGGFFLRFQNRGFVINPGPSFLENFHALGFFIQDIDYVILTGEAKESYWDLAALYELNYEQNKQTKNLHVINYYIPQAAFQSVASIIKPHFKQERQTIHPMEFYLDSFESETINLENEIHMSYFPEKDNQELGIRIDFAKNLSVAFCSDFCGKLHSLHQDCQLIVASVDQCSLNKAKESQESVASNGILIVAENTDREEERSFETAKEIRHLSTCSSYQAVFPAEMGLSFNLPELTVNCSTCGQTAFAHQVITTKSTTHRLQFLCEQCRF
ncbi:MAG: hypothetical protein JHC93_03430 [Parachlamydiales bacterium]|nr:hypothetical protein [Parachlamydiales bacterium]